ncbi:MAG: Gfo/Idh/MocA family protein [Planctomycetaceae bacterium]
MSLPRRDFVERALWIAAAALARGAGAAEPSGPAPPATGPAADGRIRVAVIGVNGQGSNHVRELLAIPGADLVAICDCDPGAYDRAVQKHFAKDRRKPPAFVQDIRRLLDRTDVDAVTIATPNHWHALAAVWAMQAGKDVYVEKPCSHNVHEGRVMTDWARKLGRICQMGVQSRSMTGMRQTLDFVRGGGVGPVTVAHALCYKRRKSIGRTDKPAPLPTGIDFDLWAGPAPQVIPVRQRLHYDWHWTHVTGNGDLGNQNPHELDKARWGLDKHELPKRVVSLGGRLGYVDNGDVANSQVTIFQWDDATLISDVRGLEVKTPVDFGLKAGRLGVANIWWGTKGYVVAPNYTSGAAFDLDGHQLGTWSGGEYKAHFANFLDAVRSRRPEDLHLDIEEGHLSSALAHMGNVSWALGEPVDPGTRPKLAADEPHVRATWESFEKHLGEQEIDYAATKLLLGRELVIDPKTERSTDDAANALFTREYRQGFELPVA